MQCENAQTESINQSQVIKLKARKFTFKPSNNKLVMEKKALTILIRHQEN
uniref:Uncharacterized protein n=1 Tax=Rhizophora mucronata TaxID=61149 RepID=A0A2P2MQN4_RHIMU